MNSKFQIGDEVVVVNSGYCYSSYAVWAYNHNLKWKAGSCKFGDTGTIVAIGNHTVDEKHIIIGIRSDRTDYDFIVDEKAIKIKKRKSFLDDDLFEI